MKTKNTLLAAAFCVGFTSMASAETVYVTGATAFRNSFVGAAIHLMGGTCTAKFDGSTVNGSNKVTLSGTISGTSYVINCAWSGSVTGIRSLTNPADIVDTFLPDAGGSTITQSGSGTVADPYTYVGGTASATGAVSGEADLAMSDVFQSSTVYTTPILSPDYTLGVVPFKFLAGEGAPAAINNMTPLLAQLLYGAGRISQTLFTGVAYDPAQYVYGLGRDNGSGTRLTVMAETGKGALNDVIQYSTTNGTTFTNVGNSGSGSGSGVAAQLGYVTAAATGYTIGYAGLSDSATAITNGAKELTWNGVAYSVPNVQGGQYTMWGYEHLFGGPSASADDLTFAATIAAELQANPGADGIGLTTMKVQRRSEGAPVDIAD